MNPKPEVVTPTPGISHFVLRNDYWKLAWWAIGEGLLTKPEADMIARVGHRKETYWGRHLQDLIEIIESREARNENKVHI